MVKVLSKADHDAIGKAIAEVESHTSAEIVAVVAAASDGYQSYMLLYNLMAGSAVATGLWAAKLITDFPVLLAIQLLAMTGLSFLPPLRRAYISLVPKRIRHHRAAHRAYEEYLIVTRHAPAATPVVLLYVSIAERYAHILTSRAVREKVPDASWKAVVDELTVAIVVQGLGNACLNAVRRVSQLLIPHFPGRGGAHIRNVIEIGK